MNEENDVILLINGRFIYENYSFDIISYESMRTSSSDNPVSLDAVLTIKDQDENIIIALHGIVDGINTPYKPIVFSIKCNPDEFYGISFINILSLFNNKKNFRGKFYDQVAATVVAYGVNYDLNDKPNFLTALEKRNKTCRPVAAIINREYTNIRLPDYDESAVNLDSVLNKVPTKKLNNIL